MPDAPKKCPISRMLTEQAGQNSDLKVTNKKHCSSTGCPFIFYEVIQVKLSDQKEEGSFSCILNARESRQEQEEHSGHGGRHNSVRSFAQPTK